MTDTTYSHLREIYGSTCEGLCKSIYRNHRSRIRPQSPIVNSKCVNKFMKHFSLLPARRRDDQMRLDIRNFHHAHKELEEAAQFQNPFCKQFDYAFLEEWVAILLVAPDSRGAAERFPAMFLESNQRKC